MKNRCWVNWEFNLQNVEKLMRNLMHIFSNFSDKNQSKNWVKIFLKIIFITFNARWTDCLIHRIRGTVYRNSSWSTMRFTGAAEACSHDPTIQIQTKPDPTVHIGCWLKEGFLSTIGWPKFNPSLDPMASIISDYE